MMQRKVLVTGATGMLGQAIVAAARSDHEVMGWSRRSESPVLATVDATSRTQVDAFFANHPMDVCVHCIAWPDVEVCENDPAMAARVNTLTTENVAAASARHGVKLIYISTEYVFDGTRPDGYRETDEPNPLQIYGRTKLLGEQHASAAPGNLIVRLPVLYGDSFASPRPAWIISLLQSLESGEPVRLDDVYLRQPTWTRDVADTLWSAIEAGLDGVLHVASQEGLTKYAWGRIMAEAARLPSSLIQPSRRPADPAGTAKPVRPWLLSDRLTESGLTALPGLSAQVDAYLRSIGVGVGAGRRD